MLICNDIPIKSIVLQMLDEDKLSSVLTYIAEYYRHPDPEGFSNYAEKLLLKTIEEELN